MLLPISKLNHPLDSQTVCSIIEKSTIDAPVVPTLTARWIPARTFMRFIDING